MGLLTGTALTAALITACSDPPPDEGSGSPGPIGPGGINADGSLPPVFTGDAATGAGGRPGGGGGPGAGGAGGGGSGNDPPPGAGGGNGGGSGGGDTWCDAPRDEVCETPFDEDCDGRIDEGCTCRAPEKPCYTGDPRDLEHPSTGCRMGVQYCEFEFYGDCLDEVLPSAEICDGIDNDCNGLIDEIPDCDNTPPEAICPPDQQGRPLNSYTFEGGYHDPDGDPMVRATWTLREAPPGSTSRPDPNNALRTTLFADLQGEYLMELEVQDARGGIGRCTTRLTTLGDDGLRIEMVWNVGVANDTSDVDLHLKRDPNATWFDGRSNGDDCFFVNCRVCESYDEPVCRAELAAINQDPNRSAPPQVNWFPPLDEDDPRLDLDDVDGNGPENINIRHPRDGTYRLGIHYWDDHDFGPSTVTVRVYCDGALAKAYDPIVLRPTGTSGAPDTEFWEVADIVWRADTCTVEDLGPANCPRICTRREAEAGGCPPNRTRGLNCP